MLMRLIYKKAVLLMLVLGSVSSATYAEEEQIAINRYQALTVLNVDPSHDILSLIVDVQFPSTVQSIGDALEFLLELNGFVLGDGNSTDAEPASQYVLFELPLPQAYRKLQTIRIRDALILLGGEGFEPVVNPVMRTIHFRLRDDYLQYLDRGRAKHAEEVWRLRKSLVSALPDATRSSDHEATRNARQYGPTQLGDTLAKLAKNYYGDRYSLNQRMIAIYEANKKAFGNDNINHLLKGQLLDIPYSIDVNEISDEDAALAVREHYQRWQARFEEPNSQVLSQ